MNVRLPSDLLAAVDTLATERGVVRSVVVRELVREGLARRGRVVPTPEERVAMRAGVADNSSP